jgi:hypothetical protein
LPNIYRWKSRSSHDFGCRSKAWARIVAARWLASTAAMGLGVGDLRDLNHLLVYVSLSYHWTPKPGMARITLCDKGFGRRLTSTNGLKPSPVSSPATACDNVVTTSAPDAYAPSHCRPFAVASRCHADSSETRRRCSRHRITLMGIL